MRAHVGATERNRERFEGADADSLLAGPWGLAAFPWLVFAMAPGLDSNQEVVFGLLATAAFIFALVIMFGLVFASEFSDTGTYGPGGQQSALWLAALRPSSVGLQLSTFRFLLTIMDGSWTRRRRHINMC